MTPCAIRQLQAEPPAVHSRVAPEASCQPLHESPGAGGASALAAQERRIAELEARVAELEDYACSVAHDLRAPIRAARCYACALEEDHGAELPHGARAFVAKIIDAAQDMDRTVVDLLALARADMPAAAMSHVDSSEIVNQALAELAPHRTERVRITVGELRNCRGHAGLLHQAWTNLLSNALKFTRERERPVIEVGSFEADGTAT